MNKKPAVTASAIALILSAAIWATNAPTTINSSDLISNSRTVLNQNFLDLYNQRATLVDCSGIAGRFVVTLAGALTASSCGTLTWSNITSLSGYPGIVSTWNGRAGAVSITAADVSGVEQDLRNSASPTFIAGTFTGSGVTSTNSTGYAYMASQSTGGGYNYTGSGIVFGGTTTGHYVMSAGTADGTCTMRADTGLSCTGAQSVLAGATPSFGNVTYTAAAPTVAAAQVGLGGSVAAASNCGSLAGAAGCLVINVAGTTRYVPYY